MSYNKLMNQSTIDKNSTVDEIQEVSRELTTADIEQAQARIINFYKEVVMDSENLVPALDNAYECEIVKCILTRNLKNSYPFRKVHWVKTADGMRKMDCRALYMTALWHFSNDKLALIQHAVTVDHSVFGAIYGRAEIRDDKNNGTGEYKDLISTASSFGLSTKPRVICEVLEDGSEGPALFGGSGVTAVQVSRTNHYARIIMTEMLAVLNQPGGLPCDSLGEHAQYTKNGQLFNMTIDREMAWYRNKYQTIVRNNLVQQKKLPLNLVPVLNDKVVKAAVTKGTAKSVKLDKDTLWNVLAKTTIPAKSCDHNTFLASK